MKKFLTMAVMAGALVVAACGGGTASPAASAGASAPAAGAGGLVGIAMPTKSSARWIADGDNLVKSL